MKTCEYAGNDISAPRSHPWVDAVGDSSCRYYDFTKSPELIRTSLEDFIPYAHHDAVEEFYSLLTDLNQSSSGLESNDSAFLGPHKNSNPAISRSVQSWGRIMILFRHLPHNQSRGNIEWLASELHQYLAVHDAQFKLGMIGTTIVPVNYLDLGKYERQQLGYQLMISFWAWGNSDRESMKNTTRVVRNLSSAIRHISTLAAEG